MVCRDAPPPGVSQAERKEEIRAGLEVARRRTFWLLGLVSDDFLKVRVHDFYSPIGWHFGHIGMMEEYWAVTRAAGCLPLDERLSFLFANIPDNPKDNRVHLPERYEIEAYLSTTRRRALELLKEADLDSPAPLLRDGYAWEFACQHELQHQETIAELLQLIHKEMDTSRSVGAALCGRPQRGGRAVLCGRPYDARSTDMIPIAGGEFWMGSDDPHGYDNEKRAHRVRVEPFALDRTHVTVTQWRAFISDGGYERPELWSAEGWEWREQEGAVCPEYWLAPEENGYYGPLGLRPMHPEEPVSSVSWYEADAYARWAGKRLPTEAEWELAARYDPDSGTTHLYPWGDEQPDTARACFWLDRWAPDPVGSHRAGASSNGVLDLAGGVWEWTSTPFLPYPGFEAYPYDGYSTEHMNGRHYVCRGGSWATAARILRSSFRNWYVPTYRQGFLGLRCAR